MRHFRYITCIFLLASFAGCKKNNPEPEPPPNPSNLKVVGYLYSDNNWNADLTTDLSQLTDLNLAFINPDENGAFSVGSDVTALITKAHQQHVKVYMSVGGGAPPPYLTGLTAEDKRSAFIPAITGVADQFGFDGVDVDLEGDLINADYADFISELAVALKAKNKLMTAALATWNADLIHDSTLARYDFINVMSYDATGPWDPSSPGPHSPFQMAEDDAHYFINTRGVDAKKILVGLPFYGYGFGGSAPESMMYREIVAQYPGAENKDMVEAGGGTIYYNGMPTIIKKVNLAKDLGAAGVMIWELNQDSHDAKSLLKAINDNK